MANVISRVTPKVMTERVPSSGQWTSLRPNARRVSDVQLRSTSFGGELMILHVCVCARVTEWAMLDLRSLISAELPALFRVCLVSQDLSTSLSGLKLSHEVLICRSAKTDRIQQLPRRVDLSPRVHPCVLLASRRGDRVRSLRVPDDLPHHAWAT